jgi:hypothetical protein
VSREVLLTITWESKHIVTVPDDYLERWRSSDGINGLKDAMDSEETGSFGALAPVPDFVDFLDFEVGPVPGEGTGR